ncbi:WD repeat-containing protein 35 [Eumeta japonica]|uniref:WD repeat-containing protein 35 n=1 Tax=Eumeta variegata TaxID=151549 RepID=A0A4C1Y2X9_EUMVA|nr:WD repeat-containing protein 35 [Eumeta japonica]
MISFAIHSPHTAIPYVLSWLLIAEASLKNFESKGALEMAEAAFVRRNDYSGIRFVAHLNALHSNALKKAEILAYFKDFDEAEKMYLNEDRRDLAIALRKRMGHWFRVVELLKMSPNTTETQTKEAYSNIGDYYIDRQKWSNAIEYYTLANNTEGLKKCYMALEDIEPLAKLNTSSPRKGRENTAKIQPDKEIDRNQEPSIDYIILLKENGKMLQAAAVAFQLATLEASKKASPLRIKKLYVLAGLLYSQNSVGKKWQVSSSSAYFPYTRRTTLENKSVRGLALATPLVQVSGRASRDRLMHPVALLSTPSDCYLSRITSRSVFLLSHERMSGVLFVTAG